MPRVCFEKEEAVALRIVGVAGEDRPHQIRHESRVHLPVAVDLDEDVEAVGERLPITCKDSAADAAVDGVTEHLHAPVGRLLLDELARLVGAGVVDTVDRLDAGSDAVDHRQDMIRDPKAWDDDRDPRGIGGSGGSENLAGIDFHFGSDAARRGAGFIRDPSREGGGATR